MPRDLKVIEMVEVSPGVFEVPPGARRERARSAPYPRSEPSRFVPPPQDRSLEGTAKVKHEVKRARVVLGALFFDDPGAREELLQDCLKILFGRSR